MKTSLLRLTVILLALSVGTVRMFANSAEVADSGPSYDMKAQSLQDLQIVQKKFVDLANAVPADKLTWRPSADSRNFAEVFLHVAGERIALTN